jgi:acyl phosphate:glycerol-3-phosphate acyltransferase
MIQPSNRTTRFWEESCGAGNPLPTVRDVSIVGYIVLALAAYLLGSIPTGFLVAKAKGIDIRKVGSGNIGATNALRILGKPAGITVLLVDALKGYSSVKFLVPMLAHFGLVENIETVQLLAGIFTVIGHNYTCWLKFKGGKGIATSAGVVLAWMPFVLGIVLAVWLVVFYLSKYVSLASIAAAAALPIAAKLMGHREGKFTVALVLGLLAIYKHKANIQRLLNGTESRFGKKKESP